MFGIRRRREDNDGWDDDNNSEALTEDTVRIDSIPDISATYDLGSTVSASGTWLTLDHSATTLTSFWCIECPGHESGTYIYNGNSYCEEHFRAAQERNREYDE